MNCCRHQQGLNEIFNEARARDEARAYLKRGLDRHARAFLATVCGDLAGASVLEVGGGVGGLHLELLKRGAATALDVDAASAYLQAAQEVADRLGLRDRVQYRQGDFVAVAGDLPPAEIVVLHRVVCCYPDMPGLLAAAAARAGRCLTFSYPRAAWYVHLAVRVINFGLWLSRSRFRTFVHAPAAMQAAAEAAGLRHVQRRSSWPWVIDAFERRP